MLPHNYLVVRAYTDCITSKLARPRVLLPSLQCLGDIPRLRNARPNPSTRRG
jgi:hypothetical protein